MKRLWIVICFFLASVSCFADWSENLLPGLLQFENNAKNEKIERISIQRMLNFYGQVPITVYFRSHSACEDFSSYLYEKNAAFWNKGSPCLWGHISWDIPQNEETMDWVFVLLSGFEPIRPQSKLERMKAKARDVVINPLVDKIHDLDYGLD